MVIQKPQANDVAIFSHNDSHSNFVLFLLYVYLIRWNAGVYAAVSENSYMFCIFCRRYVAYYFRL